MKNNRPGKLMSPTYWEWEIELGETGLTLAEFISKSTGLPGFQVEELIRFGSVHVSGKKIHDPLFRLDAGNIVRIYWPWHGVHRFYEINPERIIFRDKWVLAYNKEAGIPSQQTPSDSYNNVYHAIIRFLRREGISEPYVAIHHRLDQDTSGVIIFSVDRGANKELARAFSRRQVTKEYLVWAEGRLPSTEWIADQDITRLKARYTWTEHGKGKKAETYFRVLLSRGNTHLLLALPKTGRTHQIRIHVTASGLRIPGDRLYGGRPQRHLLLHAYRLRLKHPVTGIPLTITAPLPDYWPERESIALLLRD
ncbi:RluA family pseudouridine synthase [Thermodesulforhabdus norvegica]|uniref:23S rRNA pseudouridine1911/1915/1917 synthase n=1 Tax=Thermodesulforhabdus norvegica TaxID=39841 RepID=A0A1I4SFK6_9BACT|nr:RluA family pseudouridine synthase [Thermodesulforhabdus norvegica]SFM63232.1 23S rRNA pseudouridine1911/1915/1917 synthase [Thermodesulforhabdus norvegica]